MHNVLEILLVYIYTETYIILSYTAMDWMDAVIATSVFVVAAKELLAQMKRILLIFYVIALCVCVWVCVAWRTWEF